MHGTDRARVSWASNGETSSNTNPSSAARLFRR